MFCAPAYSDVPIISYGAQHVRVWRRCTLAVGKLNDCIQKSYHLKRWD